MQAVVATANLKAAIGANVARCRKARGWSQEQLAIEVGVSRATINRIEQGHNTIDVETLFRLADAFEVTADDLRGGK